jgi:hypothetical protein
MDLFSVVRINEKSDDKKVTINSNQPEGTQLCTFSGPIIKYEDTKELGCKESYALQVSKESYRLLDPPFRYFNHSCEPNCGLTPTLDLILIKAVEKGEELTYDYSTTMMERDWKMKCACKKDSCRKVIKDFDKLPEDLQKYYLDLNVVQGYIIEVLAKNTSGNNVL